MTRIMTSNMAAMFRTANAAFLVLFSCVSGFPLGHETEQLRSCGYEVWFVPICKFMNFFQLVYADLAGLLCGSFTTKFMQSVFSLSHCVSLSLSVMSSH